MRLSVVISAMAAAGCSPEQIAEVARAMEDADEGCATSSAAERQRRYRARLARNAVTLGDGERNESDAEHNGVTPGDAKVPPEVSSQVSPLDNNQPPFLPTFLPPTKPRESRENAQELATKSEEFYAAYPKKVDPKDAKAKFVRLAKAGTDPERIIAAARRFAEAHRSAGTDKQFIPAPAVWLNRGSYDSEDLPQSRGQSQQTGPPQRSFAESRGYTGDG